MVQCSKVSAILIYISLVFYTTAYTQIPIRKVQTINFNEEANLNSNTVGEIYIDSLNQIWLINGNTLQYFNGKECTTIDEGAWTNILPSDVKLICGDSNVAYLDIFSRKLTDNYNFHALKLIKLKNPNDIFILQSHHYVQKNLNPNVYHFCFGNILVEQTKDKFLITNFDTHTKDSFYVDPTTQSYYSLFNNQLIFTAKKNEIYRYSIKEKKLFNLNLKSNNVFGSNRLNMIQYKNKEYILSINNAVYVLDSNYNINYEIRDNNNQHVAESLINSIASDKFGNIYLGTLTNGLVKVLNNSLPIKFYGLKKEDHFFAKSIYVDKKNNDVIVSSWGKGIFVFDTLNNYKYNVLHPTFINNYTASYIFGNDPNHLYASVFQDIFLYKIAKINSKTFSLIKTKVKSKDGFDISEYRKSKTETSICQVCGNMITLNDKTITSQELTNKTAYTHWKFKNYLMILNINNIELLDNISFKEIHNIKTDFGTPLCVIDLNNDKILIGSRQGLYIFDNEDLTVSRFGLAGIAVFSIIKDTDNNIWMGTAKGIYKLDKNNTFTHFSKFDGLQDWEFNSNCVFKTPDGELFFGGLKGVNSFYPHQMSKDNKVEYFIDKILTTKQDLNQRFTSGSIITLPSDDRSVTLYFGTTGALLPQQYNKQYFVENVNKSWIDLKYDDKLTQVLGYGTHKIYYYASLQFDPNAPFQHFITIKIKTPFHSTWWFWTICSLIALSFGIYIVTTYQRLRFARTKAEWEAKETLMKERSRVSRELHDFIGANLSIIARNIDWLKTNKENLKPTVLNEKLKQIEDLSSKTNADLRDTIWATKKEAVNIEELIDRLRNFTYSINKDVFNIEFKNKALNKNINPVLAINLLRICQEAINNAYKYSQSQNLKVVFDIEQKSQLPIIEISDDGIGFDPSSTPLGYGIQNMKDRASDSNYVIDIVSIKGQGTRIKLYSK